MIEEKKDIFDKIMELPVLRILQPFYIKKKEILLYLFFGGLAFVVSIGSFAIFNLIMGVNELISNFFSWFITVLFAFITNRIWVFQSPTKGYWEFFLQLCSFFGGRIITLAIEEVLLFIFITWLGMSSVLVKTVAQVVVIVLNYFISKLLIFKER